jgi:hypothetical protein
MSILDISTIALFDTTLESLIPAALNNSIASTAITSLNVAQLLELNQKGRILGLGWALAISIVLGLILLVISLAKSQSRYAVLWWSGSVGVFASVVGILYALPKYAVGEPIVTPDLVYTADIVIKRLI